MGPFWTFEGRELCADAAPGLSWAPFFSRLETIIRETGNDLWSGGDNISRLNSKIGFGFKMNKKFWVF
jgi:hypothetical protein